jgi:hypothetical protein
VPYTDAQVQQGQQDAVAVSVIPDEMYWAPKSWAEKACPKFITTTGTHGHFAAWEQPDLWVNGFYILQRGVGA